MITQKERAVLKAITTSEYQDRDANDPMIINNGVWTFSVHNKSKRIWSASRKTAATIMTT
jgi:hypothetical protein